MSNILTAIKAIVAHSSNTIDDAQEEANNRMNQMGDALEDYVKNSFANCLGQDRKSIIQARARVFSYLGNQTNPPDAMLKGNDAIEIKKINSLGVLKLQLNSSYPKNKLHSDNPKISAECRNCENPAWKEKDMLYVVGQVDGRKLRNIFFIYGCIYCDAAQVYEGVENAIKAGIESLDSVELAETKELGRVNSVDHLGISDLRVRGMWLINSPFQYFDYLIPDTDSAFRLIALIPEDKFDSFTNKAEFVKFCEDNAVSITDVDLEEPKNPAELIKTKLITFSY